MSMVEKPPRQRTGDLNQPSESHPNSRKRPLDCSSSTPTNSIHASRIQSSNNFFKMRSLLKDLRPHFVEVLQTPDFRNCKAAQEIREKLKLLMDINRLMIEEPLATAKLNNFPQHTAPGSESEPIRRQQQHTKTDCRGTYIVGGSASGRNFITFIGHKPLYCGITKESFRATRIKLQGQ